RLRGVAASKYENVRQGMRSGRSRSRAPASTSGNHGRSSWEGSNAISDNAAAPCGQSFRCPYLCHTGIRECTRPLDILPRRPVNAGMHNRTRFYRIVRFFGKAVAGLLLLLLVVGIILHTPIVQD